MIYRSWGGVPKARHTATIPLFWAVDDFPEIRDHTALPFGNGRSYGDSCLNDGGILLDGRGLHRFLEFDSQAGLLTCEAGVLLSDILSLIVPQGWFLPVTPGTKFVTIGGAIANDVHGKNHHRAGTFGCHVVEFELLRSDGSRMVCSQTENVGLFSATIGGLGLTGIILWAKIALRKIVSPLIRSETIRFSDLSSFFRLSEDSDKDYEYTVAWIDCLGTGRKLGRGIFFRGNHAAPFKSCSSSISRKPLKIPFDFPFSFVNSWTLHVFNELYFRRQRKSPTIKTAFYETFFYPLDGIGSWNRMYGIKGFYQYQCVVPLEYGPIAIREILERIARSGNGSFLSVLKIFGDRSSPGLLSFPRKGATLAMDFSNRGPQTLDLLNSLDRVVEEAGGALYPAKDARMPGSCFRKFFPRWSEFLKYKDPKLESGFWRRVMKEAE